MRDYFQTGRTDRKEKKKMSSENVNRDALIHFQYHANAKSDLLFFSLSKKHFRRLRRRRDLYCFCSSIKKHRLSVDPNAAHLTPEDIFHNCDVMWRPKEATANQKDYVCVFEVKTILMIQDHPVLRLQDELKMKDMSLFPGNDKP